MDVGKNAADSAGNSARQLCLLDEMHDGEAIAVDTVIALDGAAAAPESVILLRQGNEVRAWLNVCPHAGRRLDWAPGKFLLKNDLLICAVHGASFATASGECIAGPCRGEHLRSVAVRVEDGAVLLQD
jgi:nitrite reductase/ring-hydroxylating ferredoxin subunit